ncbi:TPA: serine hydrolase [Candidatus Woesearchaeota archaeon]|nr:serine hydrolase [Candidatus Woesearchaeota archaeon]
MRMTNARMRKIILVLVIVIVIINVVTIYTIRQLIHHTHPASEQQYPHLHPTIAQLDEQEFSRAQRLYRTDYAPLKRIINDTVQYGPGQEYFFYMESLNTGAWIGLREKEQSFPLSLRKVPLIAAAFKCIENGTLNLSTKVTVLPNNRMLGFGPLSYINTENEEEYTIADLMWLNTYYSDNTAAEMLYRQIGRENYANTLLRMGLSYETVQHDLADPHTKISVKEYSNVLRSLYHSSYLTREHSEQTLRLLSNTSFNDGIPAGVPADIVVAHKIGYWHDGEQFHDCGIVYYPENPYILCIMTQGFSLPDANAVIANLSRVTYEYVDGLSRQ